MRASGLFFLRANAFPVRDRTTQQPLGVDMPVVERMKNEQGQWITLNTLVAHWKGPAAIAFLEANRGELRAGRPLLLELDRLYGRDDEWHGNVIGMQLAPVAPSWQKPAGTSESQASPA